MALTLIFTGFDFVLTKRSYFNTVTSDFYRSLHIGEPQDLFINNWVMKDFDTVCQLFKTHFDGKMNDQDMLLNPQAQDFLRHALSNKEVKISLLTSHSPSYIEALLTYQGFSSEDFGKLTILKSHRAINKAIASEKYDEKNTLYFFGTSPEAIIHTGRGSAGKMCFSDDVYYPLTQCHQVEVRADGEFNWTEHTKKMFPTPKQAFLAQLERIKTQGEKLVEFYHIKSAYAANTLYIELKKASDNFFTTENPISAEAFKNACDKAIEIARPKLENHHGWKQILGNIALAVLGFVLFYAAAIAINKAVTGRFLFFKTDSTHEINQIEKDIDLITTQPAA